jgi:hypothetical protein
MLLEIPRFLGEKTYGFFKGLLENPTPLKDELALDKDYELLDDIKEGNISPKRASRILRKRGLGWLKKNENPLLEKYYSCSPQERAHAIIFLEHLGFDENDFHMLWDSDKLRLFPFYECPCLDISKRLELPLEDICRYLREYPARAMAREIDSRLDFRVRYVKRHDRPFCEAYIKQSKPLH